MKVKKAVLVLVPILLIIVNLSMYYWLISPRTGLLGDTLIPKYFWVNVLLSLLISITSLLNLYVLIKQEKNRSYTQ